MARNIAAAKIQNRRLLLMREARQTEQEPREQALRWAAGELANTLVALPQAGSLEEIRGNEGYARAAYFRGPIGFNRSGVASYARAAYFGVFNHLIRVPDADFHFNGRSRRPSRDPVNATLSFLYALL